MELKRGGLQWYWTTGETWNYTNWATGEPNDNRGGEDYLVIWGPGGTNPGFWNDDANTFVQGVVVEYDVSAVPVPSAFLLLGSGLICLVRTRGDDSESPKA